MPPSKQLSFPPLVASQKWTIKSEASWPGADYTRRSRLKVTLADAYHPAFMSELEKALGDNFGCFKEALQPQAAEIPRGRPPAEHGVKLIQPSYTLRRKQTQDLQASLGASTQSLSGQVSKSRFLEQTQSAHGPTPSYMWEDREQMGSISEWFAKYGRPSPNPLNTKLYTTYEPSRRRCCGERSQAQKMKKGSLTN
ncbi:hypothetical protein AB1Y20_007902 [Prymnesium parvum]|uniref:Uncharacterized protein n=1 Tax=Prymnesium parvum TaxID=97485 RepID=A0AB34IT56_PRYPA|mmetsp:Transcript_28218/g.68534  ORF Transcript_28218/g.68534 Transcript_28218/m.68534 type:complete len:196 (-) Transcript_28218:384-971(-)